MAIMAMAGLNFMAIQNSTTSVTNKLELPNAACGNHLTDHDNVCTAKESSRLWNNNIFTASWNGMLECI